MIRGANAIRIEVADPRDPRVRRCIEELDALQSGLYPPEFNELLCPETFSRPGHTLLAACFEDAILGIGGLRRMESEYAEIKRMYVIPEDRGGHVASRLLERLESIAREKGFRILRLETGNAQPAAIRFYKKHGYRRRGAYGPYTDNPYSIFMEKMLLT